MRTLIIILISIISFVGFGQKVKTNYGISEDVNFYITKSNVKISEYDLSDFTEKSIPYLVEISLLNKIYEMPYLTPFLEPFIKIKDKIVNVKPDKLKGHYIVTAKPEVVSKSDTNKFAVILYNTLHFKVIVTKHPEGELYEANMYYLDSKNKFSKTSAAYVRQTLFMNTDIFETYLYSEGMPALSNHLIKEYKSGRLHSDYY